LNFGWLKKLRTGSPNHYFNMNDKPIIRLQINCSKIEKARLFKGEKGTYLDCTLVPTNSEYGDYMIVQDVSKDEREKNIKGAILGNAKILERRGTSRPAVKPSENDAGDSGFEPPF
jgi:hypothetical protein